MSEPACETEHLLNQPPEAFFHWLEIQGVDVETRLLLRQHMIDGFTFAMLTINDLREIGVVKMGILKRLLFLIDAWRSRYQTSCRSCLSVLSEYDFDCSHCGESHRPFPTSPICELNPKVWKVIVSAIYAFLSLGVTSFVMVLAHERLPDISKYPPLPDILLDNLPYIPWAFEAAELIAVCLCFIWFTVLFFHKYRLILFRRFCSLLGTVFLLRSVTMIITSLSVPGKHLLTECRPFFYESYAERFARAAEIWFGMGMTLRGVRTCGDYMFSGHTTVITMLNFFITEYTPCRLNRLHNFTWVLNVFGVFFILAAHEHYSIDVFIAIYITSRLFLYYHWQANNQHILQCDKRRAQIWFPLLTFFESDVHGMVPHEFSNPLRDAAHLLRQRHLRWIAAPLAALSLCFAAHPSSSVSSSVSPATPAQGEKRK